jgi:polyferredoxin
MSDTRKADDRARGETQGTERREPEAGERRPEDRRADRPPEEGPAEWFASSAMRIGLALLGLGLLLFAIGRIANVPILAAITDALSSQIGVWIVVAVFALLLIGLAMRGFTRRRR